MATIFDLIALGIMDFFGWYAEEIFGGPDLLTYFAPSWHGMFWVGYVVLDLVLSDNAWQDTNFRSLMMLIQLGF